MHMALIHNQPITEAITKIAQCLTEVTDWYGKNQLKLNTEKSEAVIFLTSKQPNDLPSDISVAIGGHQVVPKAPVRNLGVIIDSGLIMQAQVAQTAKSCYHQICNIGQIRSSVLMPAKPWYTRLVLHASTTRKRCCTCLLRVQNCAARLVSRTRKYDHIPSALQCLQWLPNFVPPTYNVLLFAYSVMHDQASCYLAELLHTLSLLPNNKKNVAVLWEYKTDDTLKQGHP